MSLDATGDFFTNFTDVMVISALVSWNLGHPIRLFKECSFRLNISCRLMRRAVVQLRIWSILGCGLFRFSAFQYLIGTPFKPCQTYSWHTFSNPRFKLHTQDAGTKAFSTSMICHRIIRIKTNAVDAGHGSLTPIFGARIGLTKILISAWLVLWRSQPAPYSQIESLSLMRFPFFIFLLFIFFPSHSTTFIFNLSNLSPPPVSIIGVPKPAPACSTQLFHPPSFIVSCYLWEQASYLDASSLTSMRASDCTLTVSDIHNVLRDSNVGAWVERGFHSCGRSISVLRSVGFEVDCSLFDNVKRLNMRRIFQGSCNVL